MFLSSFTSVNSASTTSSGDALARRFAGWEILHDEFAEFAAPNGQVKAFETLIARKPL